MVGCDKGYSHDDESVPSSAATDATEGLCTVRLYQNLAFFATSTNSTEKTVESTNPSTFNSMNCESESDVDSDVSLPQVINQTEPEGDPDGDEDEDEVFYKEDEIFNLSN